MKSKKRFYVYTLAYPDGTVFYVGKGTRYDRIHAHEQEAKRGIRSHKCNVIRKIYRDGGKVQKQKVAFFDTKEEAYRFEMQLIAFFGRDTLTNCSDGGEGRGSSPSSGLLPGQLFRFTEEEKDILKEIRTYYGLNSDNEALRFALRAAKREMQRLWAKATDA